MGLGSEMNHQVSVLHKGVHQVAVGQVTDHQVHPIQPRNRVRVTGIAQLIQHRHGSIRVILHSRVDKVSANETGSAGDQNVHEVPPLFQCFPAYLGQGGF